MLEVREVSKSFGGLRAVQGVSFNIAAGELVAIFGPNGSGKTTLLKMMAGALPVSSGEVRWQGCAITGQRTARVAAAGIVKTFQNPLLFPELTVRDHLQLATHLHLKRRLGLRRAWPWHAARAARDCDKSVDECLSMCHLLESAQRPARDLSYGEEKMLGVAMALMCEPQVLLLDEPASGLGRAEIDNLAGLLRRLRAQGKAICVIDHRIAFLANVADRAVALQQGRLIVEGVPHEVLAHPAVVDAYLGASHAAA